MQKLAPHQQEQLGKLKEEAVKAARRAEGEEGDGKGDKRDPGPFSSRLG
jgi:hypothetical protein